VPMNKVLVELSKAYIIMGARKTPSEVKKKAEDIENMLRMKLFPKIMRSYSIMFDSRKAINSTRPFGSPHFHVGNFI